ncbi:protein IQ-DOMAIN 3-like [Gastrolobium bilobum]|uniref:protein IQ-DOMAIN 3-like n=1 Tax=Gastrolobium bilobum TaxID=150636 RepID=UPI002AB2AB55|nr:protein IQ-DOMAIN 3-like [Gastrolobium bilobum]
MGRKGGWFSSVKKVFISDSKKDQKAQKHHKSKLTCFGHYHGDPEPACEESAIAVVPALPPRKRVKPKKTEAENEENKQAFSLVLATAVAAGAAVAAAAEVSRLKTEPRYPGKSNEEIAAIKIQSAFRGYLARRSLRALRGLKRLRTLVQGQSVQRQAATTLQCMQTLSRLQSQVRARKIRMSEENQALQQQLQQKREKELEKLQASQVGEKWDDSSKSKEQIEAKLLNRQVAAMRRERAMAYALAHQQTWRNSSKSANATFMDPNNPHWGWNWLERWMATRPWEGQNTMYNNDHSSIKSAAGHNTMSVGELTKLYAQRDQNLDTKNSPASQKVKSPRSHNPPSKLASKASPSLTSSNSGKTKAPSPKGGSWGGDGDLRNIFSKNSENNRRHSIAVSPVRDDESLASSPAFPSQTTSTKVSKAKSKVQSPSSGVHKNGTQQTPEKGAVVSAKKRLSFPASPVGSRRHSVPTKVGISSNNKNVATIPEDKVKEKNGGSR